jgi:hypothetical protein
MAKIRTCGELKNYLESQSLSPEKLAEATSISNMTLRRLMKKKPSAPIPERYHVQIDFYHANYRLDLSDLVGETKDFKPLLAELERSGAEVKDADKLGIEVEAKLTDSGLGKLFAGHISVLRNALGGGLPKRYRLLCLGALFYFLNPVDLIPDVTPAIGFLDDFAILSLVAGIIAKRETV